MVPVPSFFKQQHYDDDDDDARGGAGVVGDGACGEFCTTGTGGSSFGRRLMRRIAAAESEHDDPCSEAACIGSDLVGVGIGIGHNHMAEDESRTSSLNEAGSSSKGGGGGGDGTLHQEQEEPRDDEGSWLQLGIGGGRRTDPKLQDTLEPTGTRRPGLVGLDLKPPVGGGGGDGSSRSRASAQHSMSMNEFLAPRFPIATTPPPPQQAPFFFQHQHPNTPPRTAISLNSLSFPHHSEVPWGYNRPNHNLPWIPSPPSPSSSSATPSSLMHPPGPYYARLFQHPGVDVAGPSSSSYGIRVIDAPPRLHSGVWFLLQASQNQAKEPFLPQIPKSFLRIKDGKMTVLLLMKYLANKLRLDSEPEVEIRCRGQQLQPFLTLQHVRDTIWSSSRDATLLSDSSSTNNIVMILHYGRSSRSV